MPTAVSSSTTSTISGLRSPNLARSPDVAPQCPLQNLASPLTHADTGLQVAWARIVSTFVVSTAPLAFNSTKSVS
jgi:hypothetical protein